MLDRMPIPLALEWEEFSELEPFGGPHEDYRTAILAMLANGYRYPDHTSPEHWFHTLKTESRQRSEVAMDRARQAMQSLARR